MTPPRLTRPRGKVDRDAFEMQLQRTIALQDEVRDLSKKLARSQAMLRKLEWSGLDRDEEPCVCPVCYAHRIYNQSHHHAGGCELKDALLPDDEPRDGGERE